MEKREVEYSFMTILSSLRNFKKKSAILLQMCKLGSFDTWKIGIDV